MMREDGQINMDTILSLNAGEVIAEGVRRFREIPFKGHQYRWLALKLEGTHWCIFVGDKDDSFQEIVDKGVVLSKFQLTRMRNIMGFDWEAEQLYKEVKRDKSKLYANVS